MGFRPLAAVFRGLTELHMNALYAFYPALLIPSNGCGAPGKKPQTQLPSSSAWRTSSHLSRQVFSGAPVDYHHLTARADSGRAASIAVLPHPITTTRLPK